MTARLLACPSCARHVRVHEASCVFCGVALPASFGAAPVVPPPPRMRRDWLYTYRARALAASTVAIVTASCGGTLAPTEDPAPLADGGYGAPAPLYGGSPHPIEFDAASPDTGTTVDTGVPPDPDGDGGDSPYPVGEGGVSPDPDGSLPGFDAATPLDASLPIPDAGWGYDGGAVASYGGVYFEDAALPHDAAPDAVVIAPPYGVPPPPPSP